MSVVLQGGDLLAALDLIEHARDRQDLGRPILSGVLLSGHNDRLTVVASDDYRIASAEVAVSEGSPSATFGELDTSIREDMLPLVRQFLRAFKKLPVRVGITDAAVMLRFTFGSMGIEVYRQDGSYPDVWRLLDKPEAPVLFAVNPRFLADIGKAFGKGWEPVRVRREGDAATAALDIARPGYRELIMPVRMAVPDPVPSRGSGE